MLFIRKRKTSAGAISTALVESCRDMQGRPHQKVLANLYGCKTLVDAIAKLAVQRERLKQERARIAPDLKSANEFHAAIMANVVAGHTYSPKDRRQIEKMDRQRKRIVRRAAYVDRTLKGIQKDGVAIRRHCQAAEANIQEAATRYRKALADAEAGIVGADHIAKQFKIEHRRLSL